jgi:hypothetical protein
LYYLRFVLAGFTLFGSLRLFVHDRALWRGNRLHILAVYGAALRTHS